MVFLESVYRLYNENLLVMVRFYAGADDNNSVWLIKSMFTLDRKKVLLKRDDRLGLVFTLHTHVGTCMDCICPVCVFIQGGDEREVVWLNVVIGWCGLI